MKRLCLLILSLIPSRLPQGRAEFEKWSGSIISLANFPDNVSVRFALASMIPQIKPLNIFGLNIPLVYLPKAYFVGALRQGAANQVAFVIMQELKDAQQKALKDNEEAKAV